MLLQTLSMAEDQIPGISQYCDHWCERCAFTRRCADYSKGPDPFKDDYMTNPALLERVRENFKRAMDKIEVNIDRNRDVYSILALEKQKKKLLADNPLLAVSQSYAEAAQQWLRSQPGMLERLEKLKKEIVMGSTSTSGKSIASGIKEALAVIHWDASLIHSKLVEALSIRIKEQSDFLMPNDAKSDGIVKVILLSIDRSLEAWRIIFDLLPDREDDFLNVLAQLQKLSRLISHEFPTAREFFRPGFDEVKPDPMPANQVAPT